MRTLLDTNVLVSAAIKPQGKPAQILQRASVSYDLLCSEYVLEELADVLVRPHIQRKFEGMVNPERRQEFVVRVRALATIIDVQTRLNVVSDVEDNPVLASAVDGHADFLVTGDPHLLTLQRYGQCEIVSPDRFLAILQEQE